MASFGVTPAPRIQSLKTAYSLPLFARGEAYRVWATVNKLKTYPLSPIRIMVYGHEYPVTYARVPHTKGYVVNIAKKLEEAATTLPLQIAKYNLFLKPLSGEELNKLVNSVPESIAEKLGKYGSTGFSREATTWADLMRRVEAELSESEYGYLMATVQEILSEGVKEKVKQQVFA